MKLQKKRNENMEECYAKSLLTSNLRISIKVHERWEYANSIPILEMIRMKKYQNNNNNNSNHHSRDVKDIIFIYFLLYNFNSLKQFYK